MAKSFDVHTEILSGLLPKERLEIQPYRSVSKEMAGWGYPRPSIGTLAEDVQALARELFEEAFSEARNRIHSYERVLGIQVKLDGKSGIVRLIEERNNGYSIISRPANLGRIKLIVSILTGYYPDKIDKEHYAAYRSCSAGFVFIANHKTKKIHSERHWG